MSSAMRPVAAAAESVALPAPGAEAEKQPVEDKSLLGRFTNTAFGRVYVRAWKNDWIKALILLIPFVFIPLLIFLDMVVQKIRSAMGLSASKDNHTDTGRKVVDWFFIMNLSAVFVRMCVWIEVFFALNVGFVKITYIVLSWLNEQLVTVHLAGICILVVAVGFTMFLCPVVPGIPVYVFSGITIALQKDSIDFWPAIGLATALSVITKLFACTAEYYIGFFLGKSIKIQQLICVDQVGTRAIEKILNRSGLALSKITILIGGPDWPTSVTCGILRINVPQMLLGTIPVALICFPCVVAGACLTRVTGGDNDPWFQKSALAIFASTVGQGGSFCLALYFTGEVVAKHSAELEAPRPEHAVVEELTRKEQAYDSVYFEVTAWARLSTAMKTLVIFAVFFGGFSFFVTFMLSSRCFRPFQLSSRIGDSYDATPPGLNGEAHTIVKLPGAAMLVLFVVSTLMHYFYCKLLSKMARREFALRPSPSKTDAPNGETPSNGDTPSKGEAVINVGADGEPIIEIWI